MLNSATTSIHMEKSPQREPEGGRAGGERGKRGLWRQGEGVRGEGGEREGVGERWEKQEEGEG